MSGGPGEIIQIHVGQAGVQIANACWQLYCVEHEINASGCVANYPTDDSYKTFFSLSSAMRAVPRVVMVDTEPNAMDEIRKSRIGCLFHPDTLISGKEDAASNFARGYYTLGQELIECTMDHIRKLADGCRSLRGFLMFRSIGGGTGSGLGNLILERLQNAYGKLPRVEFIIFPSPSMSPVIVEPYNAVLATHHCVDSTECSFIIDNEALYDISARKLDIHSPTYSNINRIIGQVVSTFTSSQRFYIGANPAFSEFPTSLVPYPRIHFPLVSYAPLANPAKVSYTDFTTDQVTKECFDPGNQMVRCNPAKGKYMACVLLYRGDFSPAEINTSLYNLKRTNAARFVDWSPAGFKIGITQRPPTVLPGGDIASTSRTLVALGNNTAIQRGFCSVLQKFNSLLSRRAFIHHFISEGMEESTLRMASDNVCTLIRDYQKVETGVDKSSLPEEDHRKKTKPDQRSARFM